ncbi:MAG: histidine phosphatase family protein [Planctomycetaceae bacterium]|nr:histidine phosphatase family protein [Planctomycetaceae bacterium]
MSEFPSTPLRDAPPEGVTRLFLTRHGSTEANERKPFVLQGCEIDGPLTELGREQSTAVGRALREFPIHAVYSSPLRRAVETATEIARHHQLPVETVPDLRECSVGRWEGKSWDAIREHDPEGYEGFFANPVERPHPGGESYTDVLNRVAPAIRGILEANAGRNVVVVAHNLVNRVFLAEYVGIELRHARKLRQMNCCLNLLHHHQGVTELVTLNSVLHLDRLGQ